METETITALYTLTEDGGRFVIRRPNGVVAFRVKPQYRADAYELLANLNRQATKTTTPSDDHNR